MTNETSSDPGFPSLLAKAGFNMRITLHADDFAATETVNSNILQALDSHGLDSFSVIANGDALDSGADAIRSRQGTPPRIMVHLNLSEGRPIADPDRVPDLVDESGNFRYGFLPLWLKWISSGRSKRRSLEQQVEREWRRQIEVVRKVFSPTTIAGVDGHLHIQMLPFLFPVALRLAKEQGLGEIRISRELFHSVPGKRWSAALLLNIVKHALLRLLSRSAVRMAASAAIVSPDRIAGVLYSGQMSEKTTESAVRAAAQAGLTWIEILYHPGRASPSESSRWRSCSHIGAFYLDPSRDAERDALKSIGAQRSQWSIKANG